MSQNRAGYCVLQPHCPFRELKFQLLLQLQTFRAEISTGLIDVSNALTVHAVLIGYIDLDTRMLSVMQPVGALSKCVNLSCVSVE